jgi:CubicO group peptidase (beta-lactamase class C family)
VPRLTAKAAFVGLCLASLALSTGIGLAQSPSSGSGASAAKAQVAPKPPTAPISYNKLYNKKAKKPASAAAKSGAAPHAASSHVAAGASPSAAAPIPIKPPSSAPPPVTHVAKPTVAKSPKAKSAAASAPPPVATAPQAVVGPPLAIPDLEAFVDGVVADGMASDHIAGVSVAVVQNGQVILKKGYGVASLSPLRRVDPDRTLFRLASISKTFTWIALMKEVEAGHMRLDGPINLYLPEALQVRDQGFKQQVRVRDLMTHTSGFEDRTLGQLFEEDFARERPLAVYLRQERPRRVREPGVATAYSNYGVALAGAAVSNVTGKPFETLVEDEIIHPLGLGHTTFREPHPFRADLPAPLTGAMAGDFATGYRWNEGGFDARPPEFIGHIAPAAALSSTAGDMSRYMLLLLGGGTLDGVTIYNAATAHAFATPLQTVIPGAPVWNAGFRQVQLPGGVTGFGHNGTSVSFRSNLVIVPSLGLGVFITSNTETGGPLAKRLPEAIVQRFFVAPATPPAPSPGLYDQRKLYEGEYLTTRRAYARIEGFVDLFRATTRVSVTQDGYLTTESNHLVRRWVPVGAPDAGRFQSADSPDRLAFELIDGRATRFIGGTGAETFERTGLLYSMGLLETLTILTAIVAVVGLVGLAMRSRREFRQSQTQARATLMQTTQSVLFLLAMGCFTIWGLGTSDTAKLLYNWPGGWILTASALGLVAFILALVTLILLPFIWRGGRRVDSWTAGRKLRFTFTTLVFVAFGALLGLWGAIIPG